MNIAVHPSFLPHDSDACRARHDLRGFEVRNGVRCGGMRGITVGAAD